MSRVTRDDLSSDRSVHNPGSLIASSGSAVDATPPDIHPLIMEHEVRNPDGTYCKIPADATDETLTAFLLAKHLVDWQILDIERKRCGLDTPDYQAASRSMSGLVSQMLSYVTFNEYHSMGKETCRHDLRMKLREEVPIMYSTLAASGNPASMDRTKEVSYLNTVFALDSGLTQAGWGTPRFPTIDDSDVDYTSVDIKSIAGALADELRPLKDEDPYLDVENLRQTFIEPLLDAAVLFKAHAGRREVYRRCDPTFQLCSKISEGPSANSAIEEVISLWETCWNVIPKKPTDCCPQTWEEERRCLMETLEADE